MLRYKTETRPGLVALYDIRPGNGMGPFLQPRSPHGARERERERERETETDRQTAREEFQFFIVIYTLKQQNHQNHATSEARPLEQTANRLLVRRRKYRKAATAHQNAETHGRRRLQQTEPTHCEPAYGSGVGLYR